MLGSRSGVCWVASLRRVCHSGAAQARAYWYQARAYCYQARAYCYQARAYWYIYCCRCIDTTPCFTPARAGIEARVRYGGMC